MSKNCPADFLCRGAAAFFTDILFSFRVCAVFLQMPDIIVVLFDRPVGREVARFRDIDCHLLRPAHSVLISCQGLVFGLAVALEVRECHEPVFAHQLVVELFEKLPVAGFEQLIADQEVHRRR